MSTYPELDSLEIERLKKRVSELEIELAKAQAVLKENDLIEDISVVSEEEAICVNEIHKLKLASDSGILTLEDVKILDLLVKNLLAIRGKVIPEQKTNKKKGAKSVAELLSIVKSEKV